MRAAEPAASADALSEAQALLDNNEVYDSEDTLLKVTAALRALAISPLLADAYLMLAHLLNLYPEEKEHVLEMAAEAAEKTLGPEVFKEHCGAFWGIMETRPYMRAKA